MNIVMKPIGFVKTDVVKVPRHWTLSGVEGTLVIDEKYVKGLEDIAVGERIVVIFHFHQSHGFSPQFLRQTPPHREGPLGVFSICSPIRPNPIGMSVLRVLGIKGNRIHIKGLDMIDGTPVLDIKPFVVDKEGCPSFDGQGCPPKSDASRVR
ncbi:MAG: SAM-dependent methyltransferase [Thermodesulfobacteriota bacterium]|nr:SAM-dependent methyltransferase [Thermodesulfobacteriota bacterium]